MYEKQPNFTESKQGSKPEQKEEHEMGKEVLLILKIIRHGERTKGGELTDYGREVTRQKAGEIVLPEVSGGKAVGSPFKPKESAKPPRSLETADIYVEELLRSGKIEKKYATRAKEILSPMGLKSPEPFDWAEFYNSQLPTDFEEIPDEEKAKAAHIAQTATVDKILNMEKASEFNREVAGSFAVFIDNYLRMVKRLKDGSKILYVAGSHGGLIEPFLKECLVRKDQNGQTKHGFEHLEEVGGAFRPSESFDVVIETDDQGEKKVRVSFDNPDRLSGEELTLDLAKLEELRDEYLKQHHDVKT